MSGDVNNRLIWRKERMYGERDTVLWAIVYGDTPENFTVVGSVLKEVDADAIIHDHAGDAAGREVLLLAKDALSAAMYDLESMMHTTSKRKVTNALAAIDAAIPQKETQA